MKIYKGYDQEGLDAQYNNRARVADFDAVARDWDERSAAFRRRAAGHFDLSYGDGEREKLDLFPSPKKGAPVHVFLHGGYWQAMDKGIFHFVGAELFRDGAAVAFVNYPLAPGAGMGAIVASCRRSVQWLHRNAAAYGGDPERIHVSGHSAGGHLAAMLLASRRREDVLELSQTVRGICVVSGLFDLHPIRLSYLNKVLQLDTADAEDNSPVRLVPAFFRPCIVAVGALESQEYHAQSLAFEQAWRGRGLPMTHLEVPGTDHFSILDVFTNDDSPLYQTVAAQMGL